MIAKRETEWLGYILSAEGIKPINEKVQAITEKLRPKNLKDLRSFMGAINQLNKFIPNLANICAPLRPLLKHDNEWKWEKEHEEAFEKIKEAIRKITELKHFKRDLPLRIICDASREGLGAMLQQEQEEGWETTHYASRFLTEFEQKYSINELELLAVVWAVEYFRNFVYGTEFEVVSDHKALTTIESNHSVNSSDSEQIKTNANSSDSDQMSDELIQEANKPPIKTPQCYSVNQIEVLQSLGNFTFASQYESDEFLQRVIGLIKKARRDQN